MKQTLFLMMGLPGAGKTTAAKMIEELTGAVRLSSDEARLMLWPEPDFSEEEHQALDEYLNDRTTELLEAGKSVVYDANLNRYVHRKEKYALAAQLKATPLLCWVQTPRELAKHRRIDEASHHHLVTPQDPDAGAMFERIARIVEEPTKEEPFVVLDGTKITPEYITKQLNLS